MGLLSSIKGAWISGWSGVRHAFRPRMTLRYPDQKLDLQGPGYHFDPKAGVGLPGFKGRHFLRDEKCTGCQLCAIACDGVAVAIEMQTMVRNKPQNKKNFWPAVDYGRCLPPSTPITTIDGTKPLSEVRVGDKVLTHTGKFREVTRLFARRYTGKLYTFKTLDNYELLTTTEDHPILVYGEKGVSWVYASEVTPRTYLTRPVIVEEEPRERIEYSYELYHPAGRGGASTTEVVSLPTTPELMRLVGYYLSRGTAGRHGVSFTVRERDDDLKADITDCLTKVFGAGVSAKPDEDSAGLKLCVDSPRVAAFFSQFGHSADTKKLPWGMVLLPSARIGEVVRGEFWGDGRFSNDSHPIKGSSNCLTISTASREMAIQTHYMLGRLGILSSMGAQRQNDRSTCYSVTVKTPYVEAMGRLVEVPAKNDELSRSSVHISDGMVVTPVVKIDVADVVDYEVRNLEVDGDNSYVAANIAVHNCVFCGLCIDPDTPVVTNPGLKPMKEVKVGDLLLTHTGEYKPVTKVWDMRYTGTLYRIHVYGKPEPLVCTADHPIMAVSRRMSKGKDGGLSRSTEPLKFHKPGELKPGDYLVSPVVKKERPVETYEKDVPMYKIGPVKRRIVLDASPELFRLVGLYLSGGSCSGARTVRFDFVKEAAGGAADCSGLLRTFFGKPGVSRKNGESGVRLALDSAAAEAFFSQFGRGAPDKRLPDWVFFAEREKILQVVKGEWQGDGHGAGGARRSRLSMRTASEVLAFQLQQLLAKVGVVATVERGQGGEPQAYHVDVSGRWAAKLAELWSVELERSPTEHADEFHISENYVYLPIREIETQEVADHRVMDVTVEDDHTFSPLGLATSNCVDACPFDALSMTNDYELSSYDKASLKYTPDMLMLPPPDELGTAKVKFDKKRGTVTHG